MRHWANDEIGVPVHSWLWMRIKLMAWYLSWLERLNGIQWSWIQIPLRPTFYGYFKEFVSGEYHMYQVIPLHWCHYLQRTSLKINVPTDDGKPLKWNMWLNKRRNWSSCKKSALSESWTHNLVAQSVRAYICMRLLAQLSNICTILKTWKTPMGEWYF